jgi:nucleotide-binding universal stress UspA family protein
VTASNRATLPIDSIFHPTDLSEASFVAFVHALKLALLAQSELTILHATNTSGDQVSWKDFPGVRQTLERWGELPRGSPAHALANLGMVVEKVAGHGRKPVKTVTSFLQENPAQLVVLSSQGREGIPRFLKPSFASQEHNPRMGWHNAAEALTEGQRAARSATPENGVARRRKANPQGSPASRSMLLPRRRLSTFGRRVAC